ncbi:serine/arginine repetitive matrix protein 2-like, partial [Ischnura elegans]|uniref:serine/arginine repetitive matrix protein 2-like n=1 Tax=Ischnura elegans TaxID=197161 RepID=UPI001ED898DD
MRVSGRSRSAAASPGHQSTNSSGQSSGAKRKAHLVSLKKSDSKEAHHAAGAAGHHTKRRSSSAGGGGAKSSSTSASGVTHAATSSPSAKSSTPAPPTGSGGKAPAKDAKASHKKASQPATKVTKPGKAKAPSTYKPHAKKHVVVTPASGTVVKQQPTTPAAPGPNASSSGKAGKKSPQKPPTDEKPRPASTEETAVKSHKAAVKTVRKVIATPITRQKILEGRKVTRSGPLQNARFPKISSKGRPAKVPKIKKVSEPADKIPSKSSTLPKSSQKKEEGSVSAHTKVTVKKEESLAGASSTFKSNLGKKEDSSSKIDFVSVPTMVGTKKRGPQVRAEVVLKVPEVEPVVKEATSRLKVFADDLKPTPAKDCTSAKSNDKTEDSAKKGSRRRSSVGASVTKEVETKVASGALSSEGKSPLHRGQSPPEDVNRQSAKSSGSSKSPVHRGKSPGKSPAHGGKSPAYGGKSPAYGGKSPAYGGKSPAYGGKSPAYGGKSPAYGGKSPAHGGKSPAYLAKTIAMGGRSPVQGGRSPGYGSKSPAYGGKTPPYGGKSPTHGGKSPQYGDKSPSYDGKSPHYGGKSPSYDGKSPHYDGKSPQYGGKSPQYGGKSPAYHSSAESLALPKEVHKYTAPILTSAVKGAFSLSQNQSTAKSRGQTSSPPPSPRVASPRRDSSPEGFEAGKSKATKGLAKMPKDSKQNSTTTGGPSKVKKDSKAKKGTTVKQSSVEIKEEMESSPEDREDLAISVKDALSDKDETTATSAIKSNKTGRKSKTKKVKGEDGKSKEMDKEKKSDSEDKGKGGKVTKKGKVKGSKTSEDTKSDTVKVKKPPTKTAKVHSAKNSPAATKKEGVGKEDKEKTSEVTRKKAFSQAKLSPDTSSLKNNSTDDDRVESSCSIQNMDSDASDEMTLDVLLRRSTFNMREAAKLHASNKPEEAAKIESLPEKVTRGRLSKSSSLKSEYDEKRDASDHRGKKSPRCDRTLSPMVVKDSPRESNPTSPLIEFPISSVDSEPPKSPAPRMKRKYSTGVESRHEDAAASGSSQTPPHEEEMSSHKPTVVTFADSDGADSSRSPFSNESNDEMPSHWKKKVKRSCKSEMSKRQAQRASKGRFRSGGESQEDEKAADRERRTKSSRVKIGSPTAERFETRIPPLSPAVVIKEIKAGSDVGSPLDASCLVNAPSPHVEHAPESNERVHEDSSGSDSDDKDTVGKTGRSPHRGSRQSSSERKDQGVKIEEVEDGEEEEGEEDEEENSSSDSAAEEDREFPPFISLPAPTHRKRRGRGGGASGVTATSRAAAAAALRMKKMFGFWNGPKRHRVASLNALAKVHCLFENESHRAIGNSSPSADYGSSGAVTSTTTTSVATTTVSTSVCTRILRSGPGLRGVGRHWDDDASSSDSSGSDSALIVPYKRRKTPRGRAKKAVPAKKRDERAAESSTAPGSQSSSDSEGGEEEAGNRDRTGSREEENKAGEGSGREENREDDERSRGESRTASGTGSSGPGRKRQRTGSNMMMDLKDMVVRKRMASLNASAILAASYSFEKRTRKERGSTCTTSSSVQVRLLKLEKVRKQGGAEKPATGKRPVGRPRTVVKYEDISDPYDDEDDEEEEPPRPSRPEADQKAPSAGQRRTSPADAPRKPRGRKKATATTKTSAGAPTKKRRRGRPSKHEEEDEEEDLAEDDDVVGADGVLDRGGVIQLRAPKKVAVIVKDTDVTITGVYVNTRSTQGYCISGMQYRISSTSHTQTEATSTSVEAGGQALHHPHSAEHLMTPASAYCGGDPTRGPHGADPMVDPHHGGGQEVQQQPCKSYTPLGALSSMQPPVVGVTGAGHHVIGPHHPPPPHHHYLHHHHHHHQAPPPPPPPP